MPKSKAKRNVRTPEEMIADLEAKIVAVKRRAERQKVRKDPALRHINAAVRSVDKALSASGDAATRKALDEARVTLAAVLAMNGVPTKGARGTLTPRPRGGGGKVDAERVHAYLVEHPGARAEDMSAALGTDSAGLRPALKELRGDGRARTEGQARATRYYAKSSK
ncbi:MAG TPA: hypothetical protein VMT18_02915 [Planctomycetota bacterium]|nr:hypothetical protein [Planctomycetota bacterium]